MKTVKYCDSFEAEVIRGRLESEGIPACVINEYANLMLPQAGGGVPGGSYVQVVVSDEDYDKAVELLDNITPAKGPVLCPNCGSDEISFGFWEGKPWYKKLALAFLLLLSSSAKFRSRYRCKKCGAEFNP